MNSPIQLSDEQASAVSGGAFTISCCEISFGLVNVKWDAFSYSFEPKVEYGSNLRSAYNRL